MGAYSLCCAVLSRSVVSDSVTSWTAAHQAPLSTGFSRQEHWSGLPCPSSRESSLTPGIESVSVSYISFIGRWVLYHWHHVGSPMCACACVC